MKPLHGAGREDWDARPPISMWKLDRLIAGELPEAEAAELRKRAASSPELQSYLDAAGSLKSRLTLEGIRKAAASPARSSGPARQASEPAFTDRLRERLRSLGYRPGAAFAFAAALGLGLWTWQARENRPAASAAPAAPAES